MRKDRRSQGYNWARDNYGETLKFVQDREHESSSPMKIDKNMSNVRNVETCELKRKKRVCVVRKQEVRGGKRGKAF